MRNYLYLLLMSLVSVQSFANLDENDWVMIQREGTPVLLEPAAQGLPSRAVAASADYMSRLWSTKEQQTFAEFAKFFGVTSLPLCYLEALSAYMALDSQNSAKLQDLILLGKDYTLWISLWGEMQAAVASLGDRASCFANLLSAFSYRATLMNTQFHSDLIPSLLIKRESNTDAKVGRGYHAEDRLLALSEAVVSGADNENIIEIGLQSARELKAQMDNAVSLVSKVGYPHTKWTVPFYGVGMLLHAGWAHVYAPTPEAPAVFRATRTLGMTLGLKVGFATSDLDFSELGAISFEQAQELLKLSQVFSDTVSLDFEAYYSRHLAHLFGEDQKAVVKRTAESFAKDAQQKIERLHRIITLD